MFGQELDVGLAAAEELAVKRQGQAQVRAGPGLKMEVGLLGQRRASRIDDDELAAAGPGGPQDRHQVDAGGGGVSAPDDRQLCVFVVLEGDAGHLAVEAERGRGAGRRAYGARELGGAEAPEQDRVRGVLCEQAVRAAVTERQHGFGSEGPLRLDHPFDDQVEGLSPGDAPEAPVAPGALSQRRVEQAILAVEVARDPSDLGADEAGGQRMRDFRRRRPHLGDASVLDLDLERAGVGTVQRAGGVVNLRVGHRGRRGIRDRHKLKRTPPNVGTIRARRPARVRQSHGLPP